MIDPARMRLAGSRYSHFDSAGLGQINDVVNQATIPGPFFIPKLTEVRSTGVRAQTAGLAFWNRLEAPKTIALLVRFVGHFPAGQAFDATAESQRDFTTARRIDRRKLISNMKRVTNGIGFKALHFAYLTLKLHGLILFAAESPSSGQCASAAQKRDCPRTILAKLCGRRRRLPQVGATSHGRALSGPSGL